MRPRQAALADTPARRTERLAKIKRQHERLERITQIRSNSTNIGFHDLDAFDESPSE